MTSSGPHILLVDDHGLFRMGLAMVLEIHWPQACLVQAAGWQAALDSVRTQRPDVILLDVMLPDADGLDDLPALRELTPDTPIVMMSADTGPERIRRARALGARGWLPKSAPSPQVVAALQAVLRGETAFGDEAPPAADARAAVPASAEHASDGLSTRQRDILRLLGQRLPNKAIARQMALSEGEVRAEVSWLTERLDATSRLQAYEAALARGWIAP